MLIQSENLCFCLDARRKTLLICNDIYAMTPSVKDTDMDMLLPRKNSSCIHEEVAAVGGPSGLAQGGLAFDRNFPEDRRKKILWKVEIRLIPFLILLYLFAYIDRVNIGTHSFFALWNFGLLMC